MYKLAYSSIPNIPIIGYVFYCVELILIKLQLMNTVYLSEKEKKFSRLFLSQMFSSTDQLYCSSIDFGHLLKFFKCKIIVDLSNKKTINLSSENYYQLLFTLVAASKITGRTYKTLSKIYSYDWKSIM